MKLISLNTWGGRVGTPFFEFVKKNQNIDIFCFQELFHDTEKIAFDHELQPDAKIFDKLKRMLPNHTAHYCAHPGTFFGIAIFIKKEIEVLDTGAILIHSPQSYTESGKIFSRNLQWLRCREKEKEYFIINIHALSDGHGKGDTTARLKQSDTIAQFIKKLSRSIVLCGDLNLLPDTESMRHIESAGLRNLITEFGITSTRTSYYQKDLKFADYTMVSPDVHVKNFKILPDEVSDHNAMLLEFE